MTRGLGTLLGASLLLAAAVSAPQGASAQLAIGVGGGMVSSTLTGDDADALNAQSEIGLNVGAWVVLPLVGRFSFTPGVHYVQKGASLVEPGVGTGTLNLSYVEAPLLLSVALLGSGSPVGLNVFVGPSVAFEVGCSADATFGGFTITSNCGPAEADDRQTLDVGALFGGAVQISVNEVFSVIFSGGLDLGLRKLDTSADPADTKNRAFFASFGSVFPIGG